MRRITAAVAASAVALAMGLSTSPAWAGSPSTTFVPVTSADLTTGTPGAGQFNVINEGDGSGGVTTTTGPGSARGSLQLTVTGTGSHWSVYNDDHNGTKLSDITSLSYTTYTNSSTDVLDPGLQLVIDPGNTTGTDAGVNFSTLNFEPYVQPAPAPAVIPNTWQSWDVTGGVVWGSHLTGAPIDDPISWSSFISEYPNATIIGGVGVNVGSNWDAMVGNVGELTFGTASGTTEYLFEPVAYLQITTSSLPAGVTKTAYPATTLNAIGGNPSYKWSVSSGSLPKGLHLKKTTGVISGTPSKNDSGTYDFTIKVVDTKVRVKHQPSTQNSATQALSIAIS
jgi:hypothetical protein